MQPGGFLTVPENTGLFCVQMVLNFEVVKASILACLANEMVAVPVSSIFHKCVHISVKEVLIIAIPNMLSIIILIFIDIRLILYAYNIFSITILEPRTGWPFFCFTCQYVF